MKKRQLIFVFALLCSTAGAMQVTDLGTLGGEQSIASAMNNWDQIVGSSWTSNGPSHSFHYVDGQMTDLYPLNSQSIQADISGINDYGQIASGIIATNGIYYPAIYDSKHHVTTILGSFGGSYYGFNGVAMSINNAHQAAGYSYLPNGDRHAFFYHGGLMQDIGCVAGTVPCVSYAFAVNDLGQVVGASGLEGRAFLYSNGLMSDISPFNSSESYARAINNRGDIVGEYLIADHSAFHAFIYSNGIFTDIGNPGSPETVAYGINDRGQVAGAIWVERQCRGCGPVPHAFIYQNGVFTDLNDLLPANSAWELTTAFAINVNGHITGYGILNGKYRAFLITNLPQ